MKCPACGDTINKVKPHLKSSFKLDIVRKIGLWACHCEQKFYYFSDEERLNVNSLYDDNYAGFRVDEVFKARIDLEIIQHIEPLLTSSCKVLDVGCGNGQFAVQMKNAGYDVQGIDFSESAVYLCSSRGIPAVAGDFLTHSFNTTFKCCSMFDVLEHLDQPLLFVKRACELLDDDGVLILKIPAYGRLNFIFLSVFKTLAPFFLDAPAHMQFFTKNSTKKMLVTAGFKDIRFFRGGIFRGKPETTSFKRKLSRIIRRLIYLVSGNYNIYCFASASSLNINSLSVADNNELKSKAY